MKTTSFLKTVALLAAALLFTTACDEPEKKPRALVIAIDQSASIKPEQRARWRSKAEGLVKGLEAGGALLVLAIHSNTLDAEPVFKGAPPEPIPEGSPTKILIKFRQDMAEFREAARQGLAKAFDEPGQAQRTDLLSVFDRVKHDANRITEVFVMSDGLNSTPEFDLEKMLLIEDKVPAAVQQVVRQHRWTNTTLQDVAVTVILPSLEDGDRVRTPTDRQTIHHFYAALCVAVGAQLKHFNVEGD